MSVPRLLPLENIDARHRALTPAIAASFHEAATVCLDRHHAPPTEFVVRARDGAEPTQVNWPVPDQRCVDAWNNEIDATEAGACACVIAAAELREQLYAVRRAEQGSGADYYIGPAGSGIEDLEDCFRLEVGGTDERNAAAIERLLLKKIAQTRRGRSNLPAFAGVVGFLEKRILLSDVITGP
jgi:hypothetical protein